MRRLGQNLQTTENGELTNLASCMERNIPRNSAGSEKGKVAELLPNSNPKITRLITNPLFYAGQSSLTVSKDVEIGHVKDRKRRRLSPNEGALLLLNNPVSNNTSSLQPNNTNPMMNVANENAVMVVCRRCKYQLVVNCHKNLFSAGSGFQACPHNVKVYG